jgi:hypothetical protein
MDDSLPLGKVFIGLVVAVLLAFAIYLSILLITTWPVSQLSIDGAGKFGDSFGVLTSLFTGLAFAGLLTTIYLQRSELQLNRRELEETRKEFRLQSETFHRQRFEDAFYQMLALYKENLRELSIRPHEPDAKRIFGIEALNYLNTKFQKAWAAHRLNAFPTEDDRRIEYLYLLASTVQSVYVRQTRYVETLANVLILIDEDCTPIDRRPFFWRVVASQLTAYELTYLFYQAFVAPEFEPLRKMMANSVVLQERLAMLQIPDPHRHAFENVWDVTLPPKRNPFRSPLTPADIRRARKRIQKRDRERLAELKVSNALSANDPTNES